jgi:hypothetical protein
MGKKIAMGKIGEESWAKKYLKSIPPMVEEQRGAGQCAGNERQ